jgi:hypothetical protein
MQRSAGGVVSIWTDKVRLTIGIIPEFGRVTDADLAQLRGLGRNSSRRAACSRPRTLAPVPRQMSRMLALRARHASESSLGT